MFDSNRFLSKPESEYFIRKYYANLRAAVINPNRLLYNLLLFPPFPIAGENAFELLEAAFDLQDVLLATV